jgi:hypothetical protein
VEEEVVEITSVEDMDVVDETLVDVPSVEELDDKEDIEEDVVVDVVAFFSPMSI